MAKLKPVLTAPPHRSSPRKFADSFGHSTGVAEGRMIDVSGRRGDVPAPTVVTATLTPTSKCLICKFRRPVARVKEGGDA